MYHYELTLEDHQRRRRRRRWLLVAMIILLILFGNMLALATLEEPDFTIQSMSVDRISIPQRTVYIGVEVSVWNNNGVSARLLSVEGDIYSGDKFIGDFISDEVVEIPARTNFTVNIDVAISDAPLPLPDPTLYVEGKALVRVWILGLTYHFSHAIPLTYNPDEENAPPVADFSAPIWARRDRPQEFDGSNSFDPDGKIVGWTWDFGDGNRAEGPVVEHSFLAQGTYVVTLTVVDQMGMRGSTTESLRVLPV